MTAICDCAWKVIVAIIVTLTITILAIYLLAQWRILSIRSRILNELEASLDRYCEHPPNFPYRRTITVPTNNAIYQYSTAVPLLDISLNTSRLACAGATIDNPPGFIHQIPLVGIDPTGGKKTTFGAIFVGAEAQACFAFGGTVLPSELEDDARYRLVPPTDLNGFVPGILCHQGFYEIYRSVRKQLWDWWDGNRSKVTTLFITGHSLGGALSTLCAFDFAKTDNLVHYSFAAPRSGNVKYAAHFNERVPHSMRVNNTEDIVPQLPRQAGWDMSMNRPAIMSLLRSVSVPFSMIMSLPIMFIYLPAFQMWPLVRVNDPNYWSVYPEFAKDGRGGNRSPFSIPDRVIYGY